MKDDLESIDVKVKLLSVCCYCPVPFMNDQAYN